MTTTYQTSNDRANNRKICNFQAEKLQKIIQTKMMLKAENQKENDLLITVNYPGIWKRLYEE